MDSILLNLINIKGCKPTEDLFASEFHLRICAIPFENGEGVDAKNASFWYGGLENVNFWYVVA